MNTDEHGFGGRAGFSPLQVPIILGASALKRTKVRAPYALLRVSFFIRVDPCPSVVKK